MALEDLTGVDKGLAALVVTNPDGLDPKSEGDNHARGTKNVLVNTFGPMLAASVALPALGDVLTWDGVKYVPGGGVPAGAMMDFGGVLANIPAGWLNCDGSSQLTATYPALFAAIGYTWGGAGANFNLPGLARRVTVGSGGVASGVLGNAVGAQGGAETHTLLVAEMPAHRHSYDELTSTAGGLGTLARTSGVGVNGQVVGGDGAHNNLQPSAVVLKIIKI